MQIEVNEVEPCKLAIKYEAGAMDILDKRAQIINSFKKAPVPGVRPGKEASVDAIKMHYRQQIEESLKRALAEDAYHNTLFEKKLRPHGAPKFTNLMLDGGRFTCEFEMFTKPDFELGNFRIIEVPKPHEPMSSIEVAEKMMEELRIRFGDDHPFEDNEFVQSGDKVILDYEGTIDGEPVAALTAQGEMITIGKSQLASFDDNLLGMTVGETREFDFNVPEGGLPSLSGKLVHFKVNLIQGAKNVPCGLDDELAKKLGKKDFNELRDFVQGSAGARTQNALKMSVHEAIAKKLVSDNVVDVPNWMSLSEAQYLAHQSQLNWDSLTDPDKERFIEMSIQNVKLSLILDKIRETEPEAQLTDQEVFEIIKQNLANTKINKPLDEVIQEMNRTGYLQILFSRIRDEHTMDFVSKTVKVIE